MHAFAGGRPQIRRQSCSYMIYTYTSILSAQLFHTVHSRWKHDRGSGELLGSVAKQRETSILSAYRVVEGLDISTSKVELFWSTAAAAAGCYHNASGLVNFKLQHTYSNLPQMRRELNKKNLHSSRKTKEYQTSQSGWSTSVCPDSILNNSAVTCNENENKFKIVQLPTVRQYCLQVTTYASSCAITITSFRFLSKNCTIEILLEMFYIKPNAISMHASDLICIIIHHIWRCAFSDLIGCQKNTNPSIKYSQERFLASA